MSNELNYKDFPLRTSDKVRYADTDRQGHVNNAVFSSFLETGRVELLYDPKNNLLTSETSFVIASLKLDFRQEIKWPGTVEIGTGISRIGNSSLEVYQRLFQKEVMVAEATTVIVHVLNSTGKGFPLNDIAITFLQSFLLAGRIPS